MAILTIAATYLFSFAVGIAMVSTGNAFALERRAGSMTLVARSTTS